MDEPFVMNLGQAPAVGHPRRGTMLDFEAGREAFADTGINVQILEPGQPNCRYHSEPVQEDFLVLEGECRVILDGAELRLRQWDFVHCPAGTEHVFVGSGNAPCAVLMIGSRRQVAAHYPVNEVAAQYGASVARATDDPAEAYAEWRREGSTGPVANPWPLPTEAHYWGAWVDTGAARFPRYGIVTDPVLDADRAVQVLCEDGSLHRHAAEATTLVDPAILKADRPEVYERLLRLIADYVGR